MSSCFENDSTSSSIISGLELSLTSHPTNDLSSWLYVKTYSEEKESRQRRRKEKNRDRRKK